MGGLQNKVAIVTGAGRGIGAATALAFAKEGANVVITSRTVSELKDVQSKISAQYKNVEALVIEADVSKEEDVQRIFDQAEKKFSKVDILVNNAAVFFGSPFEKITTEQW